ncbi:MAG: hypothetical protein JKY19_02350 [Alcanivoracaceae bacterium]|nr:hypothetical protein [Alcanivoracaceae bacterium]
MSVQQFFSFLSDHTLWIVLFYVVILVLAIVFSYRQKKLSSQLNVKILSLLVFMVSIPGIMATIVVFYSLFFIRLNLLEVNIVVYFLPIITMIVTLLVISKKVNLNKLPGFNRLSGLMTLLVLTGLALLLLYKLRLFVGFFASMHSLLIFGIIFYFLFKIALRKLSGGKR